jgi:hypothetical protein
LIRAVGLTTSSALEHVVVVIGASLAVVVVGGFVLNILDLLTPTGWALWLLAVVLSCSYVAGRRHETPGLPRWSWPSGLERRHAAAFALAASLTTGAYALAVWDETSQQQFKYTEFWMLPSPSDGSLSVGIRSKEDTKQRFDVEVAVDGRPFAVFRPIEIAPGELWTREIPVPQRTGAQKAEARLYRLDDMRLYRRVSALVPAGPNATE